MLKGNKAKLQAFLDQHGIAQTQEAKTGGHYELAFIDRLDWPTKPSKVAPVPKKKKKAPASKAGKSLPMRRADIHGAKVVFHKGVSEKDETLAVSQLLHAREIMKAHRFTDAFGGIIEIAAKSSGSLNGTYQRRTDTTVLYPRISKKTIIHELGHRWWYRNMTRPRRLQFIAWVKGGLAPVSLYGGKDPWEAFAEAFRFFMLTQKMTPQQVETFKIVARGGRFESITHEMQELLAS
jgi:hypothetical protein